LQKLCKDLGASEKCFFKKKITLKIKKVIKIEKKGPFLQKNFAKTLTILIKVFIRKNIQKKNKKVKNCIFLKKIGKKLCKDHRFSKMDFDEKYNMKK